MENAGLNHISRHKRHVRRHSIVGQVFVYLFLGILAFMIFLPFLQLILNSLKGPKEVEADVFWPSAWYFSNYAAVFQETVMLKSFLNTFLYIIPPVICGTFMSALCAYGFARLRFPGRRILFIAMMATLVIPNIIIMIPAYVMFANFYHWLGTSLPVVIPGMFGSTVCMFFMLQYIRTIPKDMEDAATVDGLSKGGIFIAVVFPLMVPAFIAQVVLSFSGQYNDYLTPLLYLGNSTELFTVQLAINQMNSAYSVETEKLLASCVIALLPTLVLFAFTQRFFTEGITLTGLK